MRIAVAWNYPSALRNCSFRFEAYLAGFRALGHEAVMVCQRGAEEGFGEPSVHLADRAEALEEPAFWAGVNADVVLIVSWHSMHRVLSAIRSAGACVIAFADTDGKVGSRVWWRQHFARQWVYLRTNADRVAFVRNWLRQQWRQGWDRDFSEDAAAVASTAASDLVVFGHSAGKSNFLRLLASAGAGELGHRVRVVPFAINGVFFNEAIPAQKQARIVAIARWQDAQKNAALLAGALRRFSRLRPDVSVDLFGTGVEQFAHLCPHVPRLVLHGPRPPDILAQHLAAARCLVSSSRWEGCPHAALEALCSGATVVGPRLPALLSWTEAGLYGRTALAGARSLALALTEEMRCWDRSERDGQSIAARWRERIAPETICRQLLEQLAEVAPGAG